MVLSKNPTQKQVIKEHLLQHSFITSWTAINLYGITRLSEYIRQLRREGHNIETIDTPIKTKRYGKSVIAKYVLKS